MDDVIKKYVETFNESVPIQLVPASWSDDKLKRELLKCIDNGHRLELKTVNNADY